MSEPAPNDPQGSPASGSEGGHAPSSSSAWETKEDPASGKLVTVNAVTGEARIDMEGGRLPAAVSNVGSASTTGAPSLIATSTTTMHNNNNNNNNPHSSKEEEASSGGTPIIIAPTKEDIAEVDAVGSGPFVDQDGKVLKYVEDSDADSDADDNNPPDILEGLEQLSFASSRLSAFAQNSASKASPDDDRSDRTPTNALVVEAAGPSSSSSPPALPDDKLSKSDLESPWTEIDDGEGNVYYHNIATGESTWEKPPDLAPDASPQQNWVECQDDSGRSYYVNSITKETRWEKPIDEAAALSSSGNAENDNENKNENENENGKAEGKGKGTGTGKVKQEEEEEEEIEVLDGEADDWPITDRLVADVGSSYVSFALPPSPSQSSCYYCSLLCMRSLRRPKALA